ncbi:unnamed protein product, partial [Adineta ricciae]
MNSTFVTSTLTFTYDALSINIQAWFIPLDILAITSMICVILLSIVYLFLLIVDKACHTVPMLLIGNTCFIAFLAACSILSMSIFTLQNDLKQIKYQDPYCIFRGYTAYVVCTLFNFSFVLQAVHRYLTVVYPTRFFLHSA